jgi:hypothetical protein
MYCFIMQPWRALRGNLAITSITQTESCWLDLSPYQDIVAWLEVKEVSAGGGTNVQMAYQTSPTKDDSLFQAVVAAFNMGTGVTTTVMLKDSATVTLSRWLRWQLTVTGTPSSTWDATFRIFIAANVVGRGGRAKAVSGSKVVRSPASSGPAGAGSSGPSAPLHLQQAALSSAGTMLYGPSPSNRLSGPSPTGVRLGPTTTTTTASPSTPAQPIGNFVAVPKA